MSVRNKTRPFTKSAFSFFLRETLLQALQPEGGPLPLVFVLIAVEALLLPSITGGIGLSLCGLGGGDMVSQHSVRQPSFDRCPAYL